MVTALMPFKAQTISALKKLILDGIYEIPDFISKECGLVIKGLLQQEPTRRYDLNQLKRTEWLLGQNFPNSLPKYTLQVYDCNSEENNNNICPSPHEKEAYRQLKDLGISTALIRDSVNKGSRSNVTATFRIVLHRIINSTQKVKNTNCPSTHNLQINTNDSVNNCNINNNENKRTKSSKSMTKSIKSLKNIFVDKSPVNKVSKVDSINQNTSSNPVKKYRKSRGCHIL